MVIVVFIRWEGMDKLVYGEKTFGEQNVMDIVVFIRWEGKDKLERRPLENKISWSLSFSFDDTSSALDGGDSGEAGKVCTTTNQPCIGIRLVLCIIMYYVLCTTTSQPWIGIMICISIVPPNLQCKGMYHHQLTLSIFSLALFETLWWCLQGQVLTAHLKRFSYCRSAFVLNGWRGSYFASLDYWLILIRTWKTP